MGAFTDLWKSERGLLALSIIVAATVLTALGQMTVPDWKEIVIGVYGVYAVSKGATGVAQIWKGGSPVDADVDHALVSVVNTEATKPEVKP